MARSLLFTSRVWHRRLGAVLFIFFFMVSLTGLMLGWKSLFSTTVFSMTVAVNKHETHHWLPLDSLEQAAKNALLQHVNVTAGHSDKAEARLSAGYVDFQFKPDYYVRVEGAKGIVMLIEHRYGGWIQDIHDGAIVDGWLTNKAGISKKLYSSILGIALLLLSISGFYLWYKPILIRKAAREPNGTRRS